MLIDSLVENCKDVESELSEAGSSFYCSTCDSTPRRSPHRRSLSVSSTDDFDSLSDSSTTGSDTDSDDEIPRQKLDLAFLMDCTGSMEAFIEAAKKVM